MKDFEIKGRNVFRLLFAHCLVLALFSCSETDRPSVEQEDPAVPAGKTERTRDNPSTVSGKTTQGEPNKDNQNAIVERQTFAPDPAIVTVIERADEVLFVDSDDRHLRVAGTNLGNGRLEGGVGGGGHQRGRVGVGDDGDDLVIPGDRLRDLDDDLIVIEDDDSLVARNGEGLDVLRDLGKDASGDFDASSAKLAEFSSNRLASATVVEPPPVSELAPFKPESLPVPPSPLVRDKNPASVSSPGNPPIEPTEPNEPSDPEPTNPPPPDGTTPSPPSDLVTDLTERSPNPLPSKRHLAKPRPTPGKRRSLEMAEQALSNIAFNTPPKIPYGEPSYIQFVMDPSLTKEEIVKKITEKGPVATARIKITREMEVTLTGETFDITPISEQRQMIAMDETTEWKWSIVPKRPGKNRVHLVVNAIIRVDGVEMKRSKSFDRYIEIEVTGVQRTIIFLEDNWYFFAMGSVPLMFFPFRSSRLWRNRRAKVKLAQGRHDESRGIDVFVSYSSRDRIAVLRLVESLRNSGFNVWVDQGGLHGASQWSEQIVGAIEQTAAFVLVGSSHSFASHNVVKETSLASEQHKPVIPIFIEDAEIPQSLQYQLAGLQRIEYSERNHDECMTEIREALGKLGLPGS